MYIVHQFLLLYTCHKLKNFIFRFYFLQFSPLCPLISRPIIPAYRDTHPRPSPWDFSNRLCFVKDHPLPDIVLWWGTFPEISQPEGNRSQSQTTLHLFGRNVCIFYLLIMESPNVLLCVVLSFPLNWCPLYCRCHISQRMLS